MKQFVLTGLLGISSLLAHAQSQTPIDLSTGKDNNGVQLYWPSKDDTWRVKVPGSTSYDSVYVGTGVDVDATSTYWAIAANATGSQPGLSPSPIGWLTPKVHLTNNSNHDAGDQYPAASGTYKYLTTFTITVPYCKRVSQARLRVGKLAGLDKVTRIRVNGFDQPITNYSLLNGENAPACLGILVDDNNDRANHVADRLNTTSSFHWEAPNFWTGPYPFPTGYYISNLASFIQNGTNHIEVWCQVGNGPSDPPSGTGTGFICEASLEYDFGQCLAVPFTVNPLGGAPTGFYKLAALPTDPGESDLEGFEYAWYVEEFDPESMDPLYTIANPSCWQLASDKENVFEGFQPAVDAYTDEVTDMKCPADPGLFQERHTYRITRVQNSVEYGPSSYSVMVTSSEDLGKTGGAPTIHITPTSPPDLSTLIGTGSAKNAAGTEQKVAVFPNPAKGLFMIKTTASTGSIEVFDAVGKKVKQIRIQPGSTEYAVDLSGYAKGIYMVNILSGKTVSTQKLILE